MTERSVRWLRHRVAALTALAILGLSNATTGAADRREGVEMPLPYPEVWGVRLPGNPEHFRHPGAFRVAVETGDTVIEYSALEEWMTSRQFYPRTEISYSFFRREALFHGRIPDRDSDSFRDWVRFSDAAFVPSSSPIRQSAYRVFFLRHQYRGVDGPVTLRTYYRDVEGSVALRTFSEGTLEEKALFRMHETSLFPYSYVRKDGSDRLIADKVFVEVFDTPTEILYVRPARSSLGDARSLRLRAISPNFTHFALLRDRTILTYDVNRLIAVRLTDRLESPFFKEDGHLLAIEGALFRHWIAAARARLPARFDQSKVQDAQDYMVAVDDELTENILHEWRRGK